MTTGRPTGLGLLAAAALVALAACKDDAVRPTTTVTAADTADQVLTQMEHLITSDGVRRTKVVADTAYLYEASQLARLKIVTVTFFDSYGNISSTVTADSGLYEMRTGSMKSWGHVVAKTPDGRTLRSAELMYDSRQQTIASDKPFTFDRAGQHLEGNAFVSDPDFRNVTAQQPRGGETRPGGCGGGGFLLPGQ